MSNSKAIVVKGLHKTFKLPHESHSGIKQLILGLFKKGRKKGYETQHVLKGIDFEVEEGDFFGIVGRNGSGKSTLLKTLAGIYTPDKGAVQIKGTLVPFIELGVGFNPELTGRENVFLNGALLGFSRDEMEAMYDDIVDFAELERFMDQKLKNYSSGMQVRLAFSIAIRADGDILLLDEVLAVGDEAFQRKCNDYFKTLKEKGKTVVLVTHSMEDVRKFCNKAIMIRDGKIVASGNPEYVANEYSVENTKTAKTTKSEIEKNSISDILSDIQVTLLSESVVSQTDTVKIKVEYKVSEKMDTKAYVNLLDMNRGFSLYAGSTVIEATKNGYVSKVFSIKISEVNDTNIQVAVSICDKDAGVCVFLPEDVLPTFLVRRSDYPDPSKRATHAVMFDRGGWVDGRSGEQ